MTAGCCQHSYIKETDKSAPVILYRTSLICFYIGITGV
jgi:hypothetical protein